MLPLAFTSPLVLIALATLPALWWLLRLVPPRPRRVVFPPTAILFDIPPKEETPAHSPWWLTLLRLLLAALVIFAAAGPIWNPPARTGSADGPLLLILDDGWPAASTFERRIATMAQLIGEAESNGRAVAIATTGQPPVEIELINPNLARDRLRSLQPYPHTPDRAALVPSLTRFLTAQPKATITYLSDGVRVGDNDAFVAALKDLVGRHPLTLYDNGLDDPLALSGAENGARGFTATVLRPRPGATRSGTVRAVDRNGLAISEARFAFDLSDTRANVRFDLPVELRNDIARLDIPAERSAGAVQLVDARWQRRTIGVISGGTADTAQPLLSPTYYLARALDPFADIRTVEGASPSEAALRFMDMKVPMLVLTDVGTLTPPAKRALETFVNEGGILLRFAGSRLAAAGDDLSPVKLRRGGRQLGGALSWDQPQPLAPFGKDSPFADIPLPTDVLVKRQVLAEPDALLTDKTWASLADGTPLVTADRRGQGLIVLFHITADTAWSNLPISGAFVEMLKRIAALSTVRKRDTDTPLANRAGERIPPNRVLDGFGQFVRPPATAKPVASDWTQAGTLDHPPGLYGPAGAQIAINALGTGDVPQVFDLSGIAATRAAYRLGEPLDLRPHLLVLALILFALDGLAVLLLSGGLGRLLDRFRPARRASALALATAIGLGAFALPGAPAEAQQRPSRAPATNAAPSSDPALAATRQTRLAYIRTGQRDLDDISLAGLEGLTRALTSRTALEPGPPLGIDIESDEIAVLPLLYWPISPTAPEPSPKALLKLDAFMKQGGMVVFDTRDAVGATGGSTPAQTALRRILAGLDIPELEPVPKDHVLGKAFYLLKDFPGRFANGSLWVEAQPPASDDEAQRPARAADGVTPIMITGNDLAGAWAINQNGDPLLPVDGNPRQREMATRVGINIVMYVLTGNYKADQVHIPALLERLGN